MGEHALLTRLDAIGVALAASGDALALLGLGSVGAELARLDAYSDLDFFAIAQPGKKPRFLASLDWMEAVAPVAYAFQNTADGYKLLFADGIFCEFAIFEPEELARAAFAPGRMVWQAADFDASLCQPKTAPHPRELDVAWQVGEALTNLYVGLGRYRRGERLSALRFIQGHAVDRVVALSTKLATPRDGVAPDPFDPARRYEQRFPDLAKRLPAFVQGYEGIVASARAILAFLDEHFDINPAMREAILALCEGPEKR